MALKCRPRAPICALLLVGAAVAAYACCRDFYGAYLAHADRQAHIEQLREERDALAAQAQALRRHVDSMQSDDVEIERAIRLNRNLVYEGERIFRITLPDEVAETSQEETPEQRSPSEP